MRNSQYNFPGTYEVRNKLNNKAYGGQAQVIRIRWRNHVWALKRDVHRNRHLQRAWNKYGEENFDFIVVENLSYLAGEELSSALDESEIQILIRLGDRAYNHMEAAIHGLKASAETLAILSKERTERWANPEYRARVIASMVAASSDLDLRKLRSENTRAYWTTPEASKRKSVQSIAMWQNPIHWTTQSERRKANWQDPEYVKKQNKSRKASWANPESYERRVTALRAAAKRPEVLANRSAGLKKTYAVKRAKGETKWTEERKKEHSAILLASGAAAKRLARPDFRENLAKAAVKGWVKRKANAAKKKQKEET